MTRTTTQKIRRNITDRVIRLANKIKIKEYLYDHPCVICGQDNIFTLEFDHIDPSTKRETISSLSRRAINYSHIETEIEKCQVLCTCCHRRKNHNTQSWYRVLETENLTKDRKYKAKNVRRLLDVLSTRSCVECGENDPIVLEFDHLDRTTKCDSIGNLIGRSRGWAKIQREIDKCQVLCSNCHKLKTVAENSTTTYVASNLNNALIVSELVRKLETNSIIVTYKWHKHGYLSGCRERRTASVHEMNGVLKADVVIVLLPGGKGTHTELGIALGAGKSILIHSTNGIWADDGKYCSFYSHPAVRIIDHFDDIIPAIVNIKKH